MRNPGGLRLGLGPVFVSDWRIASRRWQGYALRSGFVISLLGALILTHGSQLDYGDEPSIRQLAQFGQQFFSAVVGTAITIVLLAAPAATAGAICLDRARGTMTHLLVTDLSNAEIILGKLAARLATVLGLVVGSLPVLALLTLIGGVDPADLAGSFLVTVGVALLGCSVALLFSLWAGKAHEAILATYAVWFFWLLGEPITAVVNATLGTTWTFPIERVVPYALCFANLGSPGRVTLVDYVNFLAASLAVSAALTAVAVVSLRRVCAREGGPRRRGIWAALGAPIGWLAIPAWCSGASLDGNPVYWRECRRGQSSRWTPALNFLFVGVSVVFSLFVFFTHGGPRRAGNQDLVSVNALHITIGLLMLAVSAGTSLAEERVRGSLDVLMTTTLSTREIVMGKWLGTFRKAPWLAALPVFNLLVMSDAKHAWWAGVLTVLCVLSLGAAVTSVGLAMATTFSRLGRAVGMTVGIFVLWSVGWCFLVVMTAPGNDSAEFFLMGSPFGYAVFVSVYGFEEFKGLEFVAGASVFWTMVDTAFAGTLLTVVLNTFNASLGRVEFGVGGRYRRLAPLDKSAWVGTADDTQYVTFVE